ncbi:gamma-glutamylcyclotransferase [Lacihabitans sp. CS3-21]|uniref:gamma-glutamylcyclotransferase family protein n=1 Tax=Lacihabitans sp. CS3-21 TaxID=2487332 RepID=UPI0020CDB42E|nr:gamma-glutamylcyclotransferase family protein [Lacihabitans sp. CS3-21]MCP9746885.1 gamma-glutamylcyclotransferase [Lacihabitans sp. CS3-21]
MEYLFVYGTLLSTFPENPFRLLLEKNTQFVGEAFTYGKLFLVDYYPGLIPNNPHENHKVFGEIVSFNGSLDILAYLDEYEDFNFNDISNSLYIRELKECFLLENNKSFNCHTYIYNKNVDNLKFLTNGRFILR